MLTNTAHSYTKAEVVKITIDPYEALRFMDKLKKERMFYENKFLNNEMIHIKYEDMFDKGNFDKNLANSLCKFLEVPEASLHSNQKKMNPSSLKDYVINYQHLSDIVGETDYAAYLA